MNETAELMRLRYKYRRLLMEGRIRLPLEGAVKLMGPDCAYHLYFMVDGKEPAQEEPRTPSNSAACTPTERGRRSPSR